MLVIEMDQGHGFVGAGGGTGAASFAIEFIDMGNAILDEIAPYGQTVAHWPHPAQRASCTLAIAGSRRTVSWSIREMAAAAAPPACATVSGISFGLWQAPARKIPSELVSTGPSLGCSSRKKPSLLRLIPRVWASLAASSCGSIPVARMTISTSMWSGCLKKASSQATWIWESWRVTICYFAMVEVYPGLLGSVVEFFIALSQRCAYPGKSRGLLHRHIHAPIGPA